MRGDGRVFPRGKRWWIAYYAPGPDGKKVEQREPAGDTEAQATKKLRARNLALAVHKAGYQTFQGPKAERIRITAMLDSYIRDCEIREVASISPIRSAIKHVRAFFGADRALAVTTDRVRDYLAFRQREGAANATINREVEALKGAFRVAIDSKLIATEPDYPALREDNARQGFFEKGDFFAVLSHLNDADVADYLQWFWWTGMRPGETKSLTWTCLDRETWTVRLHASDAKTRRGRVIVLDGPLMDIINRRIAARRVGCDLIFCRRGKRIGSFRVRWKRACREAGVPDRKPYDLRRTAVRNMVRSGTPERVAMAISGHTTRAVFDRYNITSEDDLRQAVTRTAAYVESLPTEPSVVPIRKKTG